MPSVSANRMIVTAISATIIFAIVIGARSAHSAHEYTVTRSDVLTGVTVSGTARCAQKTAVATELLAAVKNIPVTEGQKVNPGDILMELDDHVVAAECAKALASVDLARQELAEIKAGARKEEIIKAQQAIEQAQSKLSFAEGDYKKIGELVGLSVATKSEMEQSKNQLRVARADLRHAQAELELLQAGARPEQIAAAEAKLHLAEAELQRCHALKNKYLLRSPHAGVVTAKLVNAGEVVSPGQVLLHIHNLNTIEIRAQVQENQLAGIAPGAAAHVVTDAYGSTPLDGTVENILPRVDPESGTVTVLVRLSKLPGITLMDGMAADIALVRQERTGVLRVPAAAVDGKGDKASVSVKSGGRFSRRSVRSGATDGQWTEIVSGLSEGDVVALP